MLEFIIYLLGAVSILIAYRYSKKFREVVQKHIGPRPPKPPGN